jgi:hypothetical protein
LAISALTGCTPSDPRISGSPQPALTGRAATAAPTPSPRPTIPAASAAAASELELAGLAAAILSGPHRGDLSSRQRVVLTTIRDSHRQHVIALRSPEPAQRPTTTSTPWPQPPGTALKLTLAKSLSLLTRSEQAQAGRLRAAALSANGVTALLLGSMAVAADTFATAAVSKTAVGALSSSRPHQPVTELSDIEAIQAMVRQLHAIIYGYQLALGHLSEASPPGREALSALRNYRLFRDRLTQILIQRGASVPVAAPAYVPPLQPTTAEKSARLIRLMEVALEPYGGVWLASATQRSDRKLALNALLRTTRASLSWGAPLHSWPGWPD